ncbi:MAG TPA: hypothetical protein DD490_24145 [Acidobacteria bacterium]|nr:hypothetical protein [Acidobacteriota bacterium]
MRAALKKIETGQRFPFKLLFAYLTVKNRVRVPDVVRTLTYRPEVYGKAYNKWLHTITREDSGWAVGERELFAAFTSQLNQCPF